MRHRAGRRLASTHAPHRGLTILEVLFSIGVVVIGVLGILVVLPVAGYQTQKGLIADRAAELGKMAVREFDVRGMRRPDQWLGYNAMAPPPGWVSVTPTTGASYAIDPMFFAQNATTAGFSAFPYTDPPNMGLIRMPRITLRAAPGAVVPMTLEHAASVFRSPDDLVFERPDDRTLGPIQQFGTNNQKRQIAGHYSWMATLVPKLDRTSQTHDPNLYVLSVVVFYRRPGGLPMDDEHERVAIIQPGQFYSGGINGGDVQLTTRPGRPETDLDVQKDNWILLSRLIPAMPDPDGPGPQLATAARPLHRWYRVVAADSEAEPVPPLPASTWTRNVTLDGPDWDITSVPVTPTQATLIPSVVAVFEKTIRLENSNLWD